MGKYKVELVIRGQSNGQLMTIERLLYFEHEDEEKLKDFLEGKWADTLNSVTDAMVEVRTMELMDKDIPF